MSGRETIGVAGVAFTFCLAAFLTIAAWVINGQNLEGIDRFMTAFLGIVLVPLSTAGITAFITSHWSDPA